MTVSEYISIVEKITWTDARNLIFQLKAIPIFSENAGIAFYVEQVGKVFRLRANKRIVKSSDELQKLIDSEFLAKSEESHVSIESFSVFNGTIQTEREFLSFQIKNGVLGTSVYSNRDDNDHRDSQPTRYDKDAAKQALIDYFSGQTKEKQRIAS